MDYREVETTESSSARSTTGPTGAPRSRPSPPTGIDAAFFTGLGAVQDAELMFYDQETMEYDSMVFPEPLEMAACVGNISILDGDPFAHTHAVLSRPDGEAVAGHLDSASVWAGELHVRAFEDSLVREHDEPTDLDLWEL